MHELGDLALVSQGNDFCLTGVEWVHCLFLFPLVLGKMLLSRAKLGLFCVV